MRYIVPVPLALILASCATPPAPVVRPVPIIAPMPRPAPVAPPLANDWNDWPFTPGDWRYVPGDARYARGSASFEGSGRIFLTLTCQQLPRAMVLSGLGPGPVTVRTTSLSRTIMANAPARDSGPATVVLTANDPLFDAIAFSRGRFVVEQAGQPPLVLPPYAEIGRVIEDCRG